VVGPVALVCGMLLATLLARRRHFDPGGSGGSVATGRDPVEGPNRIMVDAAGAAVVIATAWLLTTPYALPWYDAMVWGPLALLAAGPLDLALLARLGVLALAYVPGRVVGMSAAVERFTLDFRRDVAPWLNLAVLVAVIVLAVRRPPDRPPERPADARRPEAPAPGRSPR